MNVPATTVEAGTRLPYFIVDVFTDTPYSGNPLAIVLLPTTKSKSHGGSESTASSLTYAQKLAIAKEFNLSETAFLHASLDHIGEGGEGAGTEQAMGAAAKRRWRVDIFMTTSELPFAGHPTVGTACWVLSRLAASASTSGQQGIEGAFELKAGDVALKYDRQSSVAKAVIPHDVHVHEKRWARQDMLKAQTRLGHAVEQKVLPVKENFPVVSIVKGMTFVLIELASLEELALITTMGFPMSVDGLDAGWDETFVGSYFFVRTGFSANQEVCLRTRMIEGALEDPATGSAACDLAAYLALTESKPGEMQQYAITQGVEMGRKSDILVQVKKGQSANIEEIVLGGQAVQVMEGFLTV